ncbi:MAG: helix-turn-helix transcriptional regulator [Deltaproteobacteria bacterium]|nr:helix-turn-helix transcriptional regulator [Deltaproteobacteria bacterium]
MRKQLTKLLNCTNVQHMNDGGLRAFGQKLREARVDAGLSMSVVAKRLGVTVAYVSHLEAGRTRPSAASAMKLAELCGADPDEFCILSGHIPEDVKRILYSHPKASFLTLREQFSPYGAGDQKDEF